MDAILDKAFHLVFIRENLGRDIQGQQRQQARGCSRQIANLLGLNGTVRVVHNILIVSLRKFDRYCFIVFDET